MGSYFDLGSLKVVWLVARLVGMLWFGMFFPFSSYSWSSGIAGG
jgi:hypothetical protein